SRAHSLVEADRAGIGVNGQMSRAKVLCCRDHPGEQRLADTKADCTGFDEELLQVGDRAIDDDLRDTDNRAVMFGDAERSALQLFGVDRELCAASFQEGFVIAP